MTPIGLTSPGEAQPEMTDEGSGLRSALSVFFWREIRVWRGQMPLAVAFWGYGVAAGVAIALVTATALGQGGGALQQGLLVIGGLYTLWSLIGIWRCAPNAAPFWGSLARLLTVAWALNSAFVLLFLQLDLLAGYGRG